MLKLFSPKFRSAASQLCGIFPYYCLAFSYGSVYGFQIVLIAELYKKDAEIYMSLNQLTWLASLNFLSVPSSIVTGFLTQRLGSRMVALTTAALYVASWLLQYSSTNATTTFAGRLLSIVLATNAFVLPYISEVSEPRLRSSFFAILRLAVNAGIFFPLLLGMLMYWRYIALLNLIFPVLAALTVLFTPNSPSWLASKERFDEAEKVLCWLRGWVRPSEVQAEFRSLVESVEKPTLAERTVDIEDLGWLERARHLVRPFFLRSFYRPLGTVIALHFVFAFGGTIPVESYASVIFSKLNTPIKESIATAILGAMLMTGNVIVLLVIRRTGKRKLAFFSLVTVGLCYATVAIAGFLKLQDGYLWVPPIAVIAANAVDAMGVGTVFYMVISEVFPTSVRYIGTSISLAFVAIMNTLVNKAFLYVVEAITLPGTFLLFAVANLVALVTFYFLFPETDGKSLKDIEDHFKGAETTKACEIKD